MTRLSDTQTILLSTASARGDRSILPVPGSVSAGGRALDRTLGSLLKRGLIAEGMVNDEAASWRRGEEGEFLGLSVTAAGLEAIGAEPDEAAGEVEVETNAQADSSPVFAERPSGKLGTIMAAVEAEQGATIDELAGAVGWQKHTTRAALTRLRQRGFNIRLATIGERKAYRLAAPA